MPTATLFARAFPWRFRWPVRLRAAALLLLLAMAPAAAASAQEPSPPAPAIQAPAAVAAPSSPAPSAAAGGGDGMMMTILSEGQDRMAGFRGKLARRLRSTPEIPSAILTTLTARSPTGAPTFFLRIVGLAIGAMAAGHAAQHLVYGRLVARRLLPRGDEPGPGGSALADRFPRLIAHALLTLGGMILATLIGIALITALLPDPAPITEKTVIIAGTGYLLVWAIALFWRLVLFANAATDDGLAPAARRLRRDMTASGAVGVALIGCIVWLEALGMAYDPHAVLFALFGLLTVLATVFALYVNRRTVERVFLSGRPAATVAPLERMALRLWLPAIIAYFAYAWATLVNRLIHGWPTELPLLLGAYVVAAAILGVYAAVTYATEWLVHQRRTLWRPLEESQDEGGDGPRDGDGEVRDAPRPATLDSYEALARRVAGILAAAAGVAATMSVWNVPRMHGDAAGRLISIMTICLIGYVAYHAVRIGIDRRIAEEGPVPGTVPGDEGSGHGSASRLATLLPLVRNVILLAIVGTVMISVLMDLGVNIAPLFAGAGIVGIAIGFGAQTLIRDIFSGAFFLIDDAFRKGEYIEIGSIRGTVEKISVRSMQLRHHRGPLHTVPFGEIHQLTNYSRDWVIMKLPLRITYDTDVEKVRKHIKQLGQMLLDDPELGPKFLQPLKSQGVIQMEDSAMILRVKFMTRPGDQWEIRKRVFQELHALFRREGIRFAHREVTVRFAGEATATGQAGGPMGGMTGEEARNLAAGAVLHTLGEGALDADAADGRR
ncbi:mechanosensitive ion channel family protein (plasmid) [Azospirillum humicireducens]|uniref:Mechanosensitive ion channel family protein n=1 Tax=Azospirillum humicireducens TaxID=1226968 RepID=A0A2R4VVR5_9PROT|nr:mechanosensitive ion channel family protein [Azospirillum humicireducens]AWB08524.1 mechanosensitive ion channel family protein [Azospirillum humicireducens]